MRKWTLALALLLATPALAESAAEHLAAPALPGFIQGYQAANASQSIREEIPRGETVQAWTRMVTTQRFTGLARRATPEEYAGNILASVQRSCAGARTTPVSRVTVSGRPAARFQVDCPRNPAAGGHPETFILLAVAGTSGDVHVKQVAWRGGMTAADLAWGSRFLAEVTFCASSNRSPACR